MRVKYLLTEQKCVAQFGEFRFHLRYGLQEQPSARPAQVRPGQHCLAVVSRRFMPAFWTLQTTISEWQSKVPL